MCKKGNCGMENCRLIGLLNGRLILYIRLNVLYDLFFKVIFVSFLLLMVLLLEEWLFMLCVIIIFNLFEFVIYVVSCCKLLVLILGWSFLLKFGIDNLSLIWMYYVVSFL